MNYREPCAVIDEQGIVLAVREHSNLFPLSVPVEEAWLFDGEDENLFRCRENFPVELIYRRSVIPLKYGEPESIEKDLERGNTVRLDFQNTARVTIYDQKTGKLITFHLKEPCNYRIVSEAA